MLNSSRWEDEYSEFLTTCATVCSCVDVFVYWVGTVGRQHSYNSQGPRNGAQRSFCQNCAAMTLQVTVNLLQLCWPHC